MEELRTVFDRGFVEVMHVAKAQDVAISGPPFGFYPRMPTDTVEVAVGFPVSATVTPDGDVTPFELPGGQVVTGIHVGSYESLEASYRQLTEWAAAEGHSLAITCGSPTSQIRGPGRTRNLAYQDHLAARLTGRGYLVLVRHRSDRLA